KARFLPGARTAQRKSRLFPLALPTPLREMLLPDLYRIRHHAEHAAAHPDPQAGIAPRFPDRPKTDAGKHCGGADFGFRFIGRPEEHIEYAPLAGEKNETYLVARGNVCLRLNQLDGSIDAAELVDKTVGFGLIAQPDASLCQRLNNGDRLASCGGDFADEVLIVGVDAVDQLFALGLGQRLVIRFDASEASAADEILGDAELIVKAMQIGLAENDSD